MLPVIGWALVVIGGLGVVLRSVEFVRVRIPHNYGSNPGFGAYETMALPWWGVGSFGLGVLTSWQVGVACFVLGLFTLGVAAQLLGRVFGRST